MTPDLCADKRSSRLVTNILLSFLTTSRSDSKRFEMLSILATILSWDDPERERAGLRRIDKGTVSKKVDKGKGRSQGERSAEDAAALNEVSVKSHYQPQKANCGRNGETLILACVALVLQQSVCRVPAQRSLPRRSPSIAHPSSRREPTVHCRLTTGASSVPSLVVPSPGQHTTTAAAHAAAGIVLFQHFRPTINLGRDIERFIYVVEQLVDSCRERTGDIACAWCS